MLFLDLTLPSPEENLALDEILFDEGEHRGTSVLRFWEPTRPFIVLGYTNRASREVHLDECRSRSIPVLRRFTGGGTVLQASGVLNYTIVLPIPDSGPLRSITGTNRHILERLRLAIEPLVRLPLSLDGDTDLTLRGRKISGNAQRRGRNALVFHGTILLSLDLSLVAQLLPPPSREPAYRKNRSHRDFLWNLGLEASLVKQALQRQWQAEQHSWSVPHERISELVTSRYGNPDWNFRLA